MIKDELLDKTDLVKVFFSESKELEEAENLKGFTRKGDSLYMDGIPISIPKSLATRFLEDNSPELRNFWAWLSINLNPRSRESVYDWVERNNIQLTPGGEMILYRRVVRTERCPFDPAKLSTLYYKQKKSKKSTNIPIYFDKGVLTKKKTDSCLGNLHDMFYSLKEIRFTDNYSKKESYYLGVENRMERDKCDESEVICSTSYHCGNKNYGYYGVGDTPVAVLVNPMDITCALSGENKIRTSAFTIIAFLNEDAEWADDKEVGKLIDKSFRFQKERLRALLSTANFKDFNKHEIFKNKHEIAIGMDSILKILGE